jgi:hypothetical protein
MIVFMSATETTRRPAGPFMVALFPLLFILVFLMHFRHPGDFFHFRLHYVPRDPAAVVASLMRAQNHWPLYADPHIIGYLALPFMLVCAFALYRVSRTARPRLSAVTLFVTAAGTIYLGGVFGMWTAFYRGLGGVDPSQLQGAIATFRAMTEPQGAFLLTTTLAKLAMIGLAAQSIVLWGLPHVRKIAPILICIGCALFLAFWDLDNWMLIGMTLILTGFLLLWPAFRATSQDDRELRLQ